MRVQENSLLQTIAELDQRGAAHELGYKDLSRVLQHAVRWDSQTASKCVSNAKLLSSGITPTGSELEPALPVTARAAAEGELSVEHVAAIAQAMSKLRADAAATPTDQHTEPGVPISHYEEQIVEVARQCAPKAVRTFG